jgi:hypothetical protein
MLVPDCPFGYGPPHGVTAPPPPQLLYKESFGPPLATFPIFPNISPPLPPEPLDPFKYPYVPPPPALPPSPPFKSVVYSLPNTDFPPRDVILDNTVWLPSNRLVSYLPPVPIVKLYAPGTNVSE